MNLYLIRHAEAEEKRLGQSDSERILTSKGRNELFTAAESWKNFIQGFDYIVSSQLIRAVQTAQTVKEVFHFKGEIILDKRLNPGSRSRDVADLVNELSAENIAIFGHEPDFSEHVADFISNSGATIDFKKGAIAKIAFPSKVRVGGGALQFLIPVKAFVAGRNC